MPEADRLQVLDAHDAADAAGVDDVLEDLTLLVIAAFSAILCSMLFTAQTRPQLLMSLGSLAVVLVACVLTKGRRRSAELRFVNTVR